MPLLTLLLLFEKGMSRLLEPPVQAGSQNANLLAILPTSTGEPTQNGEAFYKHGELSHLPTM